MSKYLTSGIFFIILALSGCSNGMLNIAQQKNETTTARLKTMQIKKLKR